MTNFCADCKLQCEECGEVLVTKVKPISFVGENGLLKQTSKKLPQNALRLVISTERQLLRS